MNRRLLLLFAASFTACTHVSNTVSQSVKPRPGWSGVVGGIESLMINGERYYFGHSYRNDIVLSPLISNIRSMAAFASLYMRQTDGYASPSRWEEMAKLARTDSQLTDDPMLRRLSTEDSAEFMRQLRLARDNNARATGLTFNDHLYYLMRSACDDQGREKLEALETTHAIEPTRYLIEDLIDELQGRTKVREGHNCRTIATFLINHFEVLAAHLYDNWKTLVGTGYLEEVKI